MSAICCQVTETKERVFKYGPENIEKSMISPLFSHLNTVYTQLSHSYLVATGNPRFQRTIQI